MKGPTNESVVNVMLSSGVRRVFPFKVYAWRSGLYQTITWIIRKF